MKPLRPRVRYLTRRLPVFGLFLASLFSTDLVVNRSAFAWHEDGPEAIGQGGQDGQDDREYDLAVTLSTDVTEVNEGDLVVYTVVLQNNGPAWTDHVDSESNITLAPLTYVSDNSSTQPGNYDPSWGYWTLNHIMSPQDPPVVLEVTVRVNPGTGGTTIERFASINFNDDAGRDPDLSNNGDTATITVRGVLIQTATNGVDADLPIGPVIPVGEPVTWTYEVINVVAEALTGVSVVDDQGVAVSCPASALATGESMTCTASATATAGQHGNLGIVSGTLPNVGLVSDVDPSHYFGSDPSLSIEKATNGLDADAPPGPSLSLGDPVVWTYRVTNTGNVPLTDVTVTDDREATVNCPGSSLLEGESMTCTASGLALVGQYSNLGTVSGNPAVGAMVTDTDPSHYFVAPVELTATKEDQLFIDIDGDGAADPGDTLAYTIVLTNPADSTALEASGVVFTDTLDPWTELETGSVSTSQGTVVLGNTPGDTAIEIDLGTLADGDSATLSFSARVDPAVPAEVVAVTNEGSVAGTNVLATPTQDPAGGGPTVTTVVGPSTFEIPTASALGLIAFALLLAVFALRRFGVA